jgi:uncharacterized protein (TIGR02646 family)
VIQLTRDRGRVPAAFSAVKRTENEALLLGQIAGGVFTFKSSIWKRAKTQIRAESGGKCAYCDAPTDVVAHGDVEHFRPKSVYWWLAYCYDNYLFACQICNQTHKGDNFPRAAVAMPAPTGPTPAGLAPDPIDAPGVKRFLTRCAAEKALLLDPYILDPEPLLKWVSDDTLREVRVEPRKKSGLGRTRAQTSIDGLGLNREELRFWRFRRYESLAVFRAVFETVTGSVRDLAETQLRRSMEGGSEYAGMARYFVRDEWELGL